MALEHFQEAPGLEKDFNFEFSAVLSNPPHFFTPLKRDDKQNVVFVCKSHDSDRNFLQCRKLANGLKCDAMREISRLT